MSVVPPPPPNLKPNESPNPRADGQRAGGSSAGRPGATTPQRWSVLAILSVVVLVIPLIGPLAAMVFGSLGLSATSRAASAGTPLRGRRLAFAGCVGGMALLFTELWAMDALVQRFRRDIDLQVSTGLTEVFAVTDDASASKALAVWSPHATDRISSEALAAFAEAARARYGPFSSISVVGSEPDSSSSFARQSVTMAVSFRFERGDRFGSVVAVLMPNPERVVVPSAKIAHIMIDDRENGPLSLGASSAPNAASPAPAATTEPKETPNGG
ncbi:MAG: hypothetical protein JNM94_09470 [Phycisphaerae bacterium]|nr:hypothetical protein [Phycisphaerae bacterium]